MEKEMGGFESTLSQKENVCGGAAFEMGNGTSQDSRTNLVRVWVVANWLQIQLVSWKST